MLRIWRLVEKNRDMKGLARSVFLFFAFLVSAISSQAVTLEWDPSPDAGVVEYRIYRGVLPRALLWQYHIPGTAATATLTDLLPGQLYYFSVSAIGANGVESDLSNIISFRVPSVIAQSLTATDVSVSTVEDTPVGVVLSGRSLLLLGSLTYSIDTPPIHGKLSGTLPSLVYTPDRDFFGLDQFTFRVSDGLQVSATATASILTQPVNDPPTLGALADISISENAGQQTITLSGISAGPANEIQALTISAVSSNPALIPNPTVNYTTPGSIGSIRFRPSATGTGTALVSVVVNDGEANNNIVERVFKVTVNPLPAVSDLVQTASDARSVTLSWKTDRDATCFLSYGATTNLGLFSATTFGTSHSMTLSNLAPASVYFVSVTVTESGGSKSGELWTVGTDASAVIRFEAENASAVTEPMLLGSDASARNGGWISGAVDESGTALFELNVKEVSAYRLWCRVKAPSGSGSFYIALDGGAETLVTFANTNAEWQWILADLTSESSVAMGLPIEDGAHSLTLREGAANTAFDAFALVNDSAWRPGSPGDAPVLTILESTDSSVLLGWPISDTDDCLMRVETSTDGVNFSGTTIVPAKDGMCRLYNLGRKKVYHFRIAALDDADQSPYSNVVIR
jgi:hypothetical protein